MDDIPSVLKHLANTEPDKEGFVFYDGNGRTSVLTCYDVYLLAGKFATRLKGWGFQPGDVLCNAIPNSPERVITDFGLIMAGCIGSNCQIMEKDGSDFWKASQMYQNIGVILPNQENDSAYSVMKQFIPSNLPTTSCVNVSIPTAPSIKNIILVDRKKNNGTGPPISFLDDLRQSSEEIFISSKITPASLVYIFSTSGTTGFNKLSPRTQDKILKTARMYERGPPSIRISRRPLGWIGGFPFSFLANATCQVIQDCFEGKTEMSSKQLWNILESEKCSSGFMLPQEIEVLMQGFRDHPPKHRLKVVITGGQPITKKICEALGVVTDAIIVAYASTEMGAITNLYITEPDQMQDYMCGAPLSGVSLRIVNDMMEDLETGQHGIILVKSPLGTNHYYNLTLDRPVCTEDGYFIMGDRGWLNEDGVLFVCERNDDVIHHGSILVYPGWPESVLVKIPGVSEAVVFGVSQGDGGSKLCACVALHSGFNLTQENLISMYNDYFTESGDEFFPKLTYIELFDILPKTFSGKVNKRKLRDEVLKKITDKNTNT